MNTTRADYESPFPPCAKRPAKTATLRSKRPVALVSRRDRWKHKTQGRGAQQGQGSARGHGAEARERRDKAKERERERESRCIVMHLKLSETLKVLFISQETT